MQPTADGGYVVLGETRPAGGNWDIWVLKLNATGAIEWQYLYGGSGRERPYQIRTTSDGGYVIAGETYSFGPAGPNAWILKLDSLGGVQWQKTYGGAKGDLLSSIEPTSDGGYVAAGYSYSHRSGYDAVDAWVVKLDSAGNVVWQKAYGTANAHECASSVKQTSDGGYIVAGIVSVSGVPSVWLFKLDSVGALGWQNRYGTGSGGQLCGEFRANDPDVLVTSDGGYFVDPVYFYGQQPNDGYAMKVDSAGKVLWRKQYATALNEWFKSAETTSDGGFVLTGLVGDAGNLDHPWVVRIDSTGNVQWQKTYGLTTDDAYASAVHQTSDGGVILTGVWNGQGLIVMKLHSSGNPGVCTDPSVGVDSSAVVSNNTAQASGHNAKAATPSTSVASTNVTPSATNASVSTQCTS